MASSSKLLNLTLRSSFLRSCRLASTSLLPSASRRHPGPLLPLRFCSGAPAAVDVAADPAVAAVSAGHPWPEWGEFLDKLRAKGYFKQSGPAFGVSAGEGAAGGGEAAASDIAAAGAADDMVVDVADSAAASEDTYPFRDRNRVKKACLKFARERYDLIRTLPTEDIRAIVKYGCPNTSRRAVNSAKRLREFVQVEEKDACNVCKFRGSCDRAFITPKAEDEVRTVNVVHVLLEYAIDTNSLSGESSVNKSVQESARNLLSELIILSDTAIDPSAPKPVSSTKSSEMMKGDWLCTNCNFINFARNQRCRECKAHKIEKKMGDWICTQCHLLNFASKKICFKCKEPRPKRQLNPGEWECPSCDLVNFRRNRICYKCNQDRPEDDTQDNQP